LLEGGNPGGPAGVVGVAAQGRKTVGAAADVWALGAILYELLTGRPPFVGSTVLETLDLVREHDPVPPGQLQPHVPHDLEVICLKCLQKGPADRYASAAALAGDLQAFLDGEPVSARSASVLETVVRAVRHHNLDARVAAVGTAYVRGSSVCTLAHLAAYWLWHESPRFPEIIALVTVATVVCLPVIALNARPDVMRLFPSWLRRRLWTVWLACFAASMLALALFWVANPAEEPQRLFLVYPVWLLLAGVAWIAFTDLLGVYYLTGAVCFAAVPAALLPFWAPLVMSLASSLNMLVIGLFMLAVHRVIARQAPPGGQEPTENAE
jgi:serine/threonine-protein kinase